MWNDQFNAKRLICVKLWIRPGYSKQFNLPPFDPFEIALKFQDIQFIFCAPDDDDDDDNEDDESSNHNLFIVFSRTLFSLLPPKLPQTIVSRFSLAHATYGHTFAFNLWLFPINGASWYKSACVCWRYACVGPLNNIICEIGEQSFLSLKFRIFVFALKCDMRCDWLFF